MGNYSYIIGQEGCELNFAKLELSKFNKDYLNEEDVEKLESYGLGEFMSGWKIQGYWYEEYIKFLYSVAELMDNLTENYSDNMIEMEEEQGYRFNIYFAKIEGKIKIKIGYVPMDWIEKDIDELITT
jgi:hypothetical protein